MARTSELLPWLLHAREASMGLTIARCAEPRAREQVAAKEPATAVRWIDALRAGGRRDDAPRGRAPPLDPRRRTGSPRGSELADRAPHAFRRRVPGRARPARARAARRPGPRFRGGTTRRVVRRRR